MIKVLNLFYDAHYTVPVRVDILYENSSFNTGKADLGPRSYSIQGFSGRFTNRNRTDYLKTPESNIYKRQGEEDNDQCPQNDCDPPMNDSALDKVLVIPAQWTQIRPRHAEIIL